MKSIINLGNIPLVNNLFDKQQDSLKAKKFPLEIVELNELLMKLTVDIDSKEMFSNYLYKSSINLPYVKHCEKMWEDLKLFISQILMVRM